VRLVLDTNVLISGLLSPKGPPGLLLALWNEGGPYILISAEAQLSELLRVARYPKIQARINPLLFEELAAALRETAVIVGPLPIVSASPDPDDNVMLGIAQAGQADLLVTGDKRDLLSLENHAGTNIVTARQALERLKV
jgi:putative PIN family toxin of toxin-antitoxin system